MVDCVFCRIVAGDAPAHHVIDTGPGAERVVAFLDRTPLFPGHTLVVPAAHHETLPDLPAELLGPYFAQAQRVARAMEEVLGAAGSFVAANNRISQSVPHLHTHVVPRRRKDGLRGFFWPRSRYASDEEAAADRGSPAGRARTGVSAPAVVSLRRPRPPPSCSSPGPRPGRGRWTARRG